MLARGGENSCRDPSTTAVPNLETIVGSQTLFSFLPPPAPLGFAPLRNKKLTQRNRSVLTHHEWQARLRKQAFIPHYPTALTSSRRKTRIGTEDI